LDFHHAKSAFVLFIIDQRLPNYSVLGLEDINRLQAAFHALDEESMRCYDQRAKLDLARFQRESDAIFTDVC